jgi:small-conductance mechanosensitive channel
VNQLLKQEANNSIFRAAIPHAMQNSPLEAAIVFAVALLAGFLVYRFLMRGVSKLAGHDGTGMQARFIEALRVPLLMWILLVALLLAVRDLNVSSVPVLLQALLVYSLIGLIVVSFTMAAARVTTLVLSSYFAKRGQPITTLTVTLVRIVWAVPGVLLVMNFFGLSLTPILTALGVGGLAVALGLRDTLSNLFAGFYVIIAGQFDQGDFVKLSTGEEGYVSDIRWRMTSLRTLSNHLVLIPNSKIAEAIVTNFSKPDRLMTISLPVRVNHGSDIDKVEAVLLACAAEVSAINPDLLPGPAPCVSFTTGFIEHGLELTLSFTVPEYQKQYKVLDQLRRAILKKFRAEGIEFAIPVRRVVQ